MVSGWDGANVDQSTGLLSGLCGLGIVCGGLLLIGLLVVIRLTGRGLLPLLSILLSRRAESRSVDLPPLPRRRVDLRARAQSVDFDSALAAAQAQDSATSPPTPPLNGTPQASPLPPSAPSRPWLNGRHRRPRNEDEIFGGMLDSDGDGDVDF